VILMRQVFQAGVVVAALGLSGCGGGLPGFGSGGEPAAGPGTTARNFLLYGGATVPPSLPDEPDRIYGCPAIGVLENAAAYRVGGQTASSANYQASLVNMVRECSVQGNQMAIKVGVEGRLLLGANGRSGTFSVPVRVVVKRRQDIVQQRFTRLNVTVPNGETLAEFAHVEDRIVVPITAADPDDEYDVYVGFDASGSQARAQVRRR
jgi:hypothetical protein